jgi:hypothetical protein
MRAFSFFYFSSRTTFCLENPHGVYWTFACGYLVYYLPGVLFEDLFYLFLYYHGPSRVLSSFVKMFGFNNIVGIGIWLDDVE